LQLGQIWSSLIAVGEAGLLIGCQGLNHMTGSLSQSRCEAQQQAGFWAAEIDGRHEIVGDQINLGPGD
jgi:hypothetical protein